MDGLQKTAVGTQYKGGENVSWSGINAEMGDASLHLSFILSLSLTLSLPTAMGFHNSAIKVDARERLL